MSSISASLFLATSYPGGAFVIVLGALWLISVLAGLLLLAWSIAASVFPPWQKFRRPACRSALLVLTFSLLVAFAIFALETMDISREYKNFHFRDLLAQAQDYAGYWIFGAALVAIAALLDRLSLPKSRKIAPDE